MHRATHVYVCKHKPKDLNLYFKLTHTQAWDFTCTQTNTQIHKFRYKRPLTLLQVHDIQLPVCPSVQVIHLFHFALFSPWFPCSLASFSCSTCGINWLQTIYYLLFSHITHFYSPTLLFSLFLTFLALPQLKKKKTLALQRQMGEKKVWKMIKNESKTWIQTKHTK